MHYIQVTATGPLPAIAGYAPFKAVIVLEDPVDAPRRREIAQWLVDSGCLYAMICGRDGESWEDALRRANIERVPLDEMEPRQFVMITRHRYERLRAVFTYADKHARHTHARLENLLVIHVGRDNRAVEYRSLYGKA